MYLNFGKIFNCTINKHNVLNYNNIQIKKQMEIARTIQDCKNCVFRNLLFDSLNKKDYELINNSRIEKFYQNGENIKREGDKFTSFLYLRTGLIKLYKTADTAHGLSFVNFFSSVPVWPRAAGILPDCLSPAGRGSILV